MDLLTVQMYKKVAYGVHTIFQVRDAKKYAPSGLQNAWETNGTPDRVTI